MAFYTYEVPKGLTSVIKRIIVCHDVEQLNKMVFLPTAENFIVFNRGNDGYSELHDGNKHSIHTGYFVSMRHTIAKRLSIISKVDKPIILVELTPTGFYKLFNIDASELMDQHFIIDDKTIKKYFSKVYKDDDIEKSIEYLSASLERMMHDNFYSKMFPFSIDLLLDSIENYHNFEVTVEELANEFQCSISTLERSFKKYIGLSPKSYILITKLCNTFVEYIQENKPLIETGHIYYNHSHINYLFKKVFGSNPQQYIDDILNDNLHVYQLEIAKSS